MKGRVDQDIALRQFAVPMAAPAPMAKMALMEMDRRDLNSATLVKEKEDTVGPAAPHTRSYFPEALYINPEILTDGSGNASISIPIADSITPWRDERLAKPGIPPV